jgi:hypothetical protein
LMKRQGEERDVERRREEEREKKNKIGLGR